MANDSLEKAYELLLKRRQKNVNKNILEGRTMNMSGIPLNPNEIQAAETLSNLKSDIASQGGLVKNLENTIKTTPNDVIGIAPEIAYKSRFPSVKKALGEAEDVGKMVNEDTGGLLKNSKGFSKVLPMLGMGATALAGLGIANKVQAGEFGQAGLEGADLATDYVPGLGQAKMALRPEELGNAELPPELMKERELYNAARKSKLGEPVNNPSTEQPLLAPEDRVKKEELDRILKSIISNRNS